MIFPVPYLLIFQAQLRLNSINSVTHVVKAIQAAIEKKWTQLLEKLLLSDLRNIIKILTCKPVSFKTTVLAAWVPVSFVVKYKNFFSFCVLIFFSTTDAVKLNSVTHAVKENSAFLQTAACKYYRNCVGNQSAISFLRKIQRVFFFNNVIIVSITV